MSGQITNNCLPPALFAEVAAGLNRVRSTRRRPICCSASFPSSTAGIVCGTGRQDAGPHLLRFLFRRRRRSWRGVVRLLFRTVSCRRMGPQTPGSFGWRRQHPSCARFHAAATAAPCRGLGASHCLALRHGAVTSAFAIRSLRRCLHAWQACSMASASVTFLVTAPFLVLPLLVHRWHVQCNGVRVPPLAAALCLALPLTTKRERTVTG